MSKSKFKAGDRVRVINSWHKEAPNGFEAVVLSVDNEGVWIPTPRYPTGAFHHFKNVALVYSTPPPNTVPVRIAVAVAADGGWSARGGTGESDKYVAARAGEDLTNARLTWITAHVPLPEQPAEIEGTVE